MHTASVDAGAHPSREGGEAPPSAPDAGAAIDAAPPELEGACDERGCCAGEEQCEDRGAEPSDCQPGPSGEGCVGEPDNTPLTCEPAGSYGLRVTVDTAWPAAPELGWLDAGRGALELYLLVTLDNAQETATSRVCGVRLPPLYSSVWCEAYQPSFPDTVWDAPELPTVALALHHSCDATGCSLRIDPSTYMFGINLDAPDAPWPTPTQTRYLGCGPAESERCYPDHDGDGQPGVRLQLDTTGAPAAHGGDFCPDGYQRRALPVSTSTTSLVAGLPRSDRWFAGLRARLGGTVQLDTSCNHGVGAATAEDVNTRSMGCLQEPTTLTLTSGITLATPEAECDELQSFVVDASLPDYQVLAAGETPAPSDTPLDESPSNGPRMSLVRFDLAAGPIGCEQVRSASY
ncbi:MAG: hypothetical protein ABW321_11455 [Polyangiales bacterium]